MGIELYVILAAVGIIAVFFTLKKLFKKLKAKIRTLQGFRYEKKVARYLRWHGFWAVKVTKGSGDKGVDILARKWFRKYAIQCKHYSNPVGVHAVQQVHTGKKVYKCSRAMVVTNNTFTKAAKELAEKNDVLLLPNIGF